MESTNTSQRKKMDQNAGQKCPIKMPDMLETSTSGEAHDDHNQQAQPTVPTNTNTKANARESNEVGQNLEYRPFIILNDFCEILRANHFFEK